MAPGSSSRRAGRRSPFSPSELTFPWRGIGAFLPKCWHGLGFKQASRPDPEALYLRGGDRLGAQQQAGQRLCVDQGAGLEVQAGDGGLGVCDLGRADESRSALHPREQALHERGERRGNDGWIVTSGGGAPGKGAASRALLRELGA